MNTARRCSQSMGFAMGTAQTIPSCVLMGATTTRLPPIRVGVLPPSKFSSVPVVTPSSSELTPTVQLRPRRLYRHGSTISSSRSPKSLSNPAGPAPVSKALIFFPLPVEPSPPARSVPSVCRYHYRWTHPLGTTSMSPAVSLLRLQGNPRSVSRPSTPWSSNPSPPSLRSPLIQVPSQSGGEAPSPIPSTTLQVRSKPVTSRSRTSSPKASPSIPPLSRPSTAGREGPTVSCLSPTLSKQEEALSCRLAPPAPSAST